MANNILAKMAVLISANTAAFDKNLHQSQNQFARFTGAITAGGKTLTGILGAYEIYNGLKYGIGVMEDFEATMSEVKAITGATGREFDALQNDALRLGAATKFTSKEVGQLQVAYGRLGFTTKEILQATKATLDLAAATGEDLAKSADVAGSTVRGFSLDASETQRVVDVMAASFNKSALGLDNFTESMKYVAPVANAAGSSVEETTALLATLADAGIRGSMAGTSLRKIFTDLPKDGRPLQERLAELAKKGITVADAMDEVGRTAQTSLLILTKNTEKTNQLAEAFRHVEGEAANMARTMQDNLTGDVEKLSSAWEGLILKIGNTEPIRNAAQGITALINAISGTPDVDTELHQLANAIQDGIPNVDGFISKLSEVRRELGQPIDTSASYINFLAEKYKLTSEQANKLYQSILKANEALSFQERALKQFNEFAQRNGYKDIGKAVDDYKQRLYELILAEQINKSELQKFAQLGGDYAKAYDPLISKSSEQIAAYRRIIEILNEYKSTLKSVSQEQQKVNQTAPPEPKWQGMGSSVTDSLTPFDDRLVSIVEPWKLISNKYAEYLDKIKAKSKETTDAIKQDFIDLSPMISTGIAGIAEAMGQAMAGVGNFGDGILKAVGAFASQLGQALIGIGTAMLAAKAMIKNPYTAIAAGVALVALSSALNASMSKSQQNFNSGGGASMGRTATANSTAQSGSLNTEGREIKVSVEGVIEGDNIRWILNRNTQLNSRRR